ncbi:MAG: hypothetical protein GY821_10355 [Gammaproteobacteria bacterium]|nr:hypothetical protein [Gammaproteobacteria bacterium]
MKLLGIANERHIDNRNLTRWVKAGRGKSFAHETMEWAWESFQRKRYSNQYHLQHKLADVEAVIKHMESTGMPDLHSGGTCTNLKATNRSIKQQENES